MLKDVTHPGTVVLACVWQSAGLTVGTATRGVPGPFLGVRPQILEF